MHVTKILRFDWLALFLVPESQKVSRNGAVFYSAHVSGISFWYGTSFLSV